MTKITPGENGIPLPEKIPAGTPKIVPTNTNIHLAGVPVIVPSGQPDIVHIVQTHSRTDPQGHLTKGIAISGGSDSEYGDLAGQTNPATGDTLQPPKTVPAIDTSAPLSVRRAGIPEVVLAKDAYIRDDNPENFSSFSKLQGLKHDVIRCMLQDKSGNLWFGTGGGVSKYDGKCFTHFTEKQGLSNNIVWSILQDNSGNLWFGTDGGVS
ncbi:MAG: hypothetical protein HY738_15735, partial [Bacteroidia bacterium]|nr:hypothetical protein [Bacteroidia bacterium]